MDTIDALRAIVGETGVLSAADIATRSAGMLRPDTLKARALVRPKDTEEVSKVVGWCHDNGMRIVTQGGLTGLVHGADASPEEVIVSMERMRAIEAIDPVQRVAVVQAGVTLQALQEAVEQHDLSFPLDLGARGTATLGGNAATNAGGNRVIRYGMMRDMILGLEVVLADGTIVSSMNRLIKNNAGYDLKQVFVGSEGTLGIITRLVLRLREKPRSQDVAIVAVPTFEALTKLLKHIDSALGGSLSAFEVMWQSFYRLVTSPPATGQGAGQSGPSILRPDRKPRRQCQARFRTLRCGAGIRARGKADFRRGGGAVRQRPACVLVAARRRRAGRGRRYAGRIRHLPAAWCDGTIR